MVWAPYFNAELRLAEDVAFDERASSALDAFLALTAKDRLEDTRHVYAYYRDIEQMYAKEIGRRLEMVEPEVPEAIWANITPTELSFEVGRQGDPHTYVVAECECDWEVEHGLMLVWRDGITLCKVSDYDGHITNANAFGDASMKDVVYAGFDTNFRTFITN